MIEWTGLTAATATIGMKVAVYGDFRQFLVAVRLGMRAEIVPSPHGSESQAYRRALLLRNVADRDQGPGPECVQVFGDQLGPRHATRRAEPPRSNRQRAGKMPVGAGLCPITRAPLGC